MTQSEEIAALKERIAAMEKEFKSMKNRMIEVEEDSTFGRWINLNLMAHLEHKEILTPEDSEIIEHNAKMMFEDSNESDFFDRLGEQFKKRA